MPASTVARLRPARAGGRASRRRGVGRETAVAALLSVLLSAAMDWPGLAHPASTVPEDLGDPLLQTWQLAWVGHALRSAPWRMFDANAFWPLPDSLAFSDSLLGYAPAGLVGSGTTAALVRYNLVFVLAGALAALGPYLLARQLGIRSRWAAALTGTACAWAPWRIAHAGHLNILSTGGIALSLALLVRGTRRNRARLVLLGWAVAVWQVSLGFALGLPFSYLLGLLAVVAALGWLRGPRPAVRTLRAHLAGGAGFAVAAGLLALPYFAVVHAHPEARRTVADVRLFSPPLWGYLVAPAQDGLWGLHQTGLRSKLAWPPEMTLGVGGCVLVLAVAGVLLAHWRWRFRIALAASVLAAAVLGAGTTVAGGRYSYLPLLAHLPGFSGLRTPGRLVVYVSLGLGLLAAAGAQALGRHVRLVPVVAVLIAGCEGIGTVPHPAPAASPQALTGAPSPVLVLPSDEIADTTAMWWSTAGFPDLVNGSSGFTPTGLATLRTASTGFPDAAAVDALRRRGVASVVVPAGGPAPAPTTAGVTVRRYPDGSSRYRLSR